MEISWNFVSPEKWEPWLLLNPLMSVSGSVSGSVNAPLVVIINVYVQKGHHAANLTPQI